MKERGRIPHTDKIPERHVIGPFLIALSEMLLKIPIEEYKSPLTEAVTRRGHGRSVFSVSIDTCREKAMFTAACAMFTMFSLTPTIAVPIQTSAQGKPQLLGATSRHFQNRKKKSANMLVVCFSLFQHAVNFLGGVYLCLPVCGANG